MTKWQFRLVMLFYVFFWPVDKQYLKCSWAFSLWFTVPLAVSGSTGDNVTIPCYAAIPKSIPSKTSYVLWEKDGKRILLLVNGNVTHDPMLTNRVSVSEEGYKTGDLSLHLTDVRTSDEGIYSCHYSNTRETDHFRGGPRAVKLIVQSKLLLLW